MTILPVIAVSGIVLLVAYRTYARFVTTWLGADPSRRTPAVEFDDGNDFVPAPAPVVLGGHFTAIAAAGPVVGPILAGLAFGWLPALLWILIGAIFIGGVHDAGTLLTSIRHRASSITQVVRANMSRAAYLTFLGFVWLCLVYLIIAFADVTSGTFARFQRFEVDVAGQGTMFSLNGGAVAIGATAYLALSIVMGLVVRFTRLPWPAGLMLAVVALTATIAYSPALAEWGARHGLSFLATQGNDAQLLARGWNQALLVYCLVASTVPMWLLLQPRGVIGATFLYATLAFGIVGTFIGGWSGGSLSIHWPAVVGFDSGRIGSLFPFLFITIACGACSGFHSIVSSGTTSKQVRCEGDVRPIAYGAMLLEAMVAVFALSCVMVLTRLPDGATPDAIYARGIGNFMSLLGIPMHFAIGFGLLAFSSFVFDTLDVCTRLGRYVVQEMFGLGGRAGAVLATAITLAAPSAYLWSNPPGKFMTFWTLFGTSNQLLAALTLVAVSIWLWKTGRPVWFALVPALLMLVTTFVALAMNFRTFITEYGRTGVGSALTNAIIIVVLAAMGTLVAAEAMRSWLKSRSRCASEARDDDDTSATVPLSASA